MVESTNQRRKEMATVVGGGLLFFVCFGLVFWVVFFQNHGQMTTNEWLKNELLPKWAETLRSWEEDPGCKEKLDKRLTD